MNITKVKNIIISGTNFWNPGDDFVRDGIIEVLKRLFKGYTLNFLFYNFNQDFFPQNKFSGIANIVAKGDLNQYRQFVDAIVIAGLSAGNEIKDLYNWIIENELYDRVYLIGAGYENTYVDYHIYKEPETTIFKHAKIITGRTRKTPQFIPQMNLLYYHINCPAILSVKQVKTISPGKKIEKIGFSIQLPHEVGVSNHCCDEKMYRLSLDILVELSEKYEVDIIGHHKSEYVHFLNLFGGKIPVIFSSYYQDLFDIYPDYDFFITTRLHSSLFANGHGIPGIILNDTDRHTHCLEGFPHSVWVDNKEKFYNEFEKFCKSDLCKIAEEARNFKENLMNRYIEVLAKPFGIELREKDALSSELDKEDHICIKKQPDINRIVSALKDSITGIDVKSRVLSILSKLTADHWLTRNIEMFRASLNSNEIWFDQVTFLNWYAYNFKPANYLEIGVRRGRSISQILIESPATKAYGFDLWLEDYGSIHEKGIITANPGPAFVTKELQNLGIQNLPLFIVGDSHTTLPAFFSDPLNPQLFELITVDGDHSYEGARMDLDITFDHLAPGGALVFDDILHPVHPELKGLWDEYKGKFKEILFIEDEHGCGTGVAFKPPFDKLLNFLNLSIKDYGQERNLLPIHFFTIVLNGEPFIRYHIDIFKKLPFKWHWHIIEGVAELKHDTAWSLRLGGHITDELHNRGLSNDGTSEYIDLVAREFPYNVTVYRKPYNRFWDGKLEMVNAPLVNIHEECLLWQVDVDELWTSEQISSVRDIFAADPAKTSAFYLCHYFVGEKLVITSRNTYGNHTDYEWLRTWMFKPGYKWISHEPPRLCTQNCDGHWVDISTINPFLHKDTESKNLIFQHYAYVIEKQLRFKELYYGYKNAAIQWKKLQEERKCPLLLKYYFDWVHDETQVNTIYSQNIIPLLDINKDKKLYRDVYITSDKVLNILWIRTDSIGDNILASSMLPYIRDKYKNATITVLCQKHIRELYEPCPFIDNIITFEKSRVYREECYRNKIIQKLKKLKPEISFNSVYSREPLTDVFSINCEARYTIAFNGDFANGMTEEIRQKNNRLYTTILSNDGEYKPELERHRDFLRNIGINVADIKPLVWITEKDEQFARDLFCKYNLHTEKTIVLFAGALVPVRLYKYYGKALSHVFKNNDITVIALGIDKDYEVSQSNLQDTGVNIINLCGKTTLRESAAIMKKCHLAIGAETGLAHLACAVGVRNVVILGGGHFGRFMPYSPLTSVVCLPLECYVCNWHCKYQKPHCVYDIIPEVFAAAIIQTIKKSSDKPRIFVQGKSLWSPSANQPVWALFDKYLNINNFDIITIDDISTNEIELAEAILLVNQLRETGLLEEALISSEEIIRKYPASPELLNLHAELKFQTGHFEEARSLFVNLADRFPHDSRILNNAGAALWNERNAEKAMDYLIKALAFDRDNRPAILNLGDILVSLNKYDDAISLFLSYMERNPYDEDIKDIMEQIKSLSGKQKYENIISEYISVVNELRQMGLIQDAYLTLSEATAQCQDSPELLNLQAEIQYQMGNIEEAKNNFLELSVRFSDHSQILNNLGVIYLQEGCPEKALEYYRKSLHVNPDDRVATLNLADLMITLNNIDEAERILSSYIERHKDDEIIRGFLDSVKEQKKEKVVVSEILEEIKEIMKDGELDLARLALKGLLCDHPDNPELLHLQDLINAQRKTSCQVKT